MFVLLPVDGCQLVLVPTFYFFFLFFFFRTLQRCVHFGRRWVQQPRRFRRRRRRRRWRTRLADFDFISSFRCHATGRHVRPVFRTRIPNQHQRPGRPNGSTSMPSHGPWRSRGKCRLEQLWSWFVVHLATFNVNGPWLRLILLLFLLSLSFQPFSHPYRSYSFSAPSLPSRDVGLTISVIIHFGEWPKRLSWLVAIQRIENTPNRVGVGVSFSSG